MGYSISIETYITITTNIIGAKCHPSDETIAHHLLRFRLLAVKQRLFLSPQPCR